MAETYIKSSNIQIFPLSKPRTYTGATYSNRLFYENNISNITRQVTIPSFTIDLPQLSALNSNLITFNIFGYYVQITGSSVYDILSHNTTDKYCYAKLNLSAPVSNNTVQKYLTEVSSADDVNGDFTGLQIVTSNTPLQDDTDFSADGKLTKYLLLYEKTDNNWTPTPTSPFEKFNVVIKGIDGKTK